MFWWIFLLLAENFILLMQIEHFFKLLIYIQTFDYYILTSSHVEQVERFCLNDKGEFQGELDLSSFREQNLKSGNQDFIRKHWQSYIDDTPHDPHPDPSRWKPRGRGCPFVTSS